jgi:large subunit ribosomal protein L15
VPGEIKRVEYQVVNLGAIARVFTQGEVTPEALAKAGLVRPGYPVKVLANGEIGAALRVTAHRFSAAATQKIKAAGGEAIALEGSGEGA